MTTTCELDLDRWADDGGAAVETQAGPAPKPASRPRTRRQGRAVSAAKERDARHAALAALVKAGDSAALDELIADVWKLIYLRARKFAKAFEPFADEDDLAQAGLQRVAPAAKRYDPSRGYPFITYALSAACREMVHQARLELHRRRFERQQRTADGPGPLDYAEARRDRLPAESVAVASALQSLKPMHREVLTRMTGYDQLGRLFTGSERLADEYGFTEEQVWKLFDEAAAQVRQIVSDTAI